MREGQGDSILLNFFFNDDRVDLNHCYEMIAILLDKDCQPKHRNEGRSSKVQRD